MHGWQGQAETAGNESTHMHDTALAALAARQEEAEQAFQAQLAAVQTEATQRQQELQRRLQDAEPRVRDPNTAAQVIAGVACQAPEPRQPPLPTPACQHLSAQDECEHRCHVRISLARNEHGSTTHFTSAYSMSQAWYRGPPGYTVA